MSQTMGFRKINIHLQKAASAIKNLFSEVYEPKIFMYDFSCEEKTDVTGLKSKSVLSTYNVDYFWIELNNDFRISLFYKDFDASSGNIHVLPGILQIWKKDVEIPEKTLDEMEKTHIGTSPFREEDWSPLLIREFNFLWSFYLSEMEGILRKHLAPVVFLKDVSHDPENTCMSVENYQNFFSNDYSSSSGRGKYSQYAHWKNHKQPKNDGFFYTLSYTWKDKNDLWWTRYGDIQFWSHEVMQSNGRNTTHEWSADEGWALGYPVTNERQKFYLRTVAPGMNIYKDDQKDVDAVFEDYCDQVKNYSEPHGIQIKSAEIWFSELSSLLESVQPFAEEDLGEAVEILQNEFVSDLLSFACNRGCMTIEKANQIHGFMCDAFGGSIDNWKPLTELNDRLNEKLGLTEDVFETYGEE